MERGEFVAKISGNENIAKAGKAEWKKTRFYPDIR